VSNSISNSTGDPSPNGGPDLDFWTTEEADHNTKGWGEGSGDSSEIVEIERPGLAEVFQDLPLPLTGSDQLLP
jgi:hypothetical protein